jgi:hypothetical protein
LRAERLHGAHFVVGLGEIVEELRQQRIDALLEGRIPGDHLVARLEIVLRIVLELLEEGVQIALETDRAHHLLHLPTDARDFRQAERMDLLGRHVCRGRRAHLERVPRGAIRQRGPAHRRARVRDVLFLDVIGEARVGGQDLPGDRAAKRRGQP